MRLFFKKASKKDGLPPGTMIHIGAQKAEKVKVTLLNYNGHEVIEQEVSAINECARYKDSSSITWLNVAGLQQIETIEEIGRCFDLHPLLLEDIVNTEQRPKLEDYGQYFFIVLKALGNNDDDDSVSADQVSLVLGSRFLISFMEHETDFYRALKERIKNHQGRLRELGADFLAYTVIDAVVDKYFIILEQLEEEMEFLEEELLTSPTPATLQEIHNYKRELVMIRKWISPLREVVGALERLDSPLIQPGTDLYFRDVYDHAVRIIETIDTFRDMLSGMMDIYLSSVSNKLNSVMKVLTIFATIFMPLTLISSIYGMNFKYMPELEWRYGYPMVWILLITLGVSLLFYFKNKKWL